MAYYSIKDLPKAILAVDEDMNIQDTYLCVYDNDTMNMTDINNLSMYNKFKIDKKVKTVETALTEALQNKKFIGNVYTTEDDGTLVLSQLKLEDVSKLLKTQYKSAIGVRYTLNINTGEMRSTGRRVIVSGNNIYYEGIDIEAEGFEFGISSLLPDGKTEVLPDKNTCLAENAYPWNEMKKVQISLDDKEISYDVSKDNGGNYFTEVPLYYVRTQYLLEKEIPITGLNGSSTIKYEKLYDLTSTLNNESIKDSIPEEYKNETDTTIGVYYWVSKYPLTDFRPAEFFIHTLKCEPVEDNDMYDSSIPRYVKLVINFKEYYLKYSDFENSEILPDSIPKKYCLLSARENSKDVNILDGKHYFACYESSTDTIEVDGVSKTIAISRPNVYQKVSETLSNYRTYVKNLGDKYYIKDIKSNTDFYQLLMAIEYKTLDTQSKIRGVSELDFNNYVQSYFDQNDTNKIFISDVYSNMFTKYQTINCYSKNGDMQKSLITKISYPTENIDYTIERHKNDNSPVQYYVKIVDNKRTYITDSTIADNDTVYYKITISTVKNPIYVKVISELKYEPAPSGFLKEEWLQLFKGFIYVDGYHKLACINIDTKMNVLSSYIVHSLGWICGSTDKLAYRTGYIGNNGRYPFKWNWIENPYGNLWKMIDGCYSMDNAIDGIDKPHNAYYICDNIENYSNYSKYKLIDSFYGPGIDGSILRYAYNANKPWAQLPCYVKSNSSSSYSDIFYQKATMSSKDLRLVLSGGGFFYRSSVGMYCISVHVARDSKFNAASGISFERNE